VQSNVVDVTVELNSAIPFTFAATSVGVLLHEITEAGSAGSRGWAAGNPLAADGPFRFTAAASATHPPRRVTTFFGIDERPTSPPGLPQRDRPTGHDDGGDLPTGRATRGDVSGRSPCVPGL
jgi:hypothetical protein